MTKISYHHALQSLDSGRTLTDMEIAAARLHAVQMVLRSLEGFDGGEALAEKCWNTIMDIASGAQTERIPFDRDDRDILAAARTVSPAAVLTSGDVAYMQADHADWLDHQRTMEDARP